MANYGVLYVFRFESANKTNIEIQILKKDYSGARTYRSLGRAPILKREKSGCVHGSSLELYAECQVDGEFASLYTSSADEYKVEVYKIDEFLGDTFQRRVWTGFVSPELYSEPDIAPPYDVQIIATDGLGELKNYAFEARGLHSVQDHLEYMLGHTGLSQEFNVVSFMAGDSGTVPIMDVTVSLDHMAGESCYDVLKAVLDSFHAEIACQDGYWMIWRETDIVNLTSQVEVAEFGSQTKTDWWPVGQLSTVIEPAKKRVTVISEDAYKDNVLKDVPYHADGATYDSEEKAFILPTAGTSVLKTLRFGAEVGYKLSLTVTARNIGSGDEGQPIGIKVKIEGRSPTVGDTFWLRERTDGKIAWTNTEGVIEKMLEAPAASDSAKDAQTIALELPLYSYSNRVYHYATSVEVTIFNVDGDYPIHVYDVTLSKLDQVKGYKSVLEIDNGAREETDEATLIIADDDRIPAAADIFMNGIALNASGEPISSWASGRMAAMGYLAFMSRDYALSVALPRMKVQGVLNVPDSALITPVLFLRDNTYYFPETYDYDLLNDELSVSLVSIPTAQIEVVSEEVTEVVDPFQSRPGSSAGGGSSSGGSSGGGEGSGEDSLIFEFEFDSATNKATAEMVAALAEAIAADKLILCAGRTYKFILEQDGMYGLVSDTYLDIMDGKLKASVLAVMAVSYDVQLMEEEVPTGTEITESTIAGWGFTKNKGTITGITMNGATKGTSGVVNLGNVLTEHQKLKTINNQSIVGEGNINIQGGATPRVEMTASSAVLQPNTFHVWQIVDALDLTLGAEQSGVMNRYLFQFRNPKTGLTVLTLPDDITWSEDTELDENGMPVMEAAAFYRIEIIEGLASLKKWKLVYINFADAEVERVLMSKGIGDGIGITKQDAKAVTSISNWFMNNTTVTSFDELRYFTGITNLVGYRNDGAFQGCTNLRGLILPANMTVVGQSSFKGCTALEYLNIPQGVHDIPQTFCKGCSALLVLSVNWELILTIGSEAFSGCTALVTEIISNSIKDIADWAFYNSGVRGVLHLPNLEKIGNRSFKNTDIEEVTSLGKITELGKYESWSGNGYGTFAGCTALWRVVLHEGIILIGHSAFRGCTSLANLNWVDSIEIIEEEAFRYTPQMAIEISLSNNLKKIADWAFFNSGVAGELYAPNLEEIKNRSFKNCRNLTKVSSIGDKITELGKYESWSSEGYGVFAGCTGLVSFRLPMNVRLIGSYAFCGCTALVNMEWRDTIEIVEEYAFQGCTSWVISHVITSLVSIGNFAFSETQNADIVIDCPNLSGDIGYNAFYKSGVTEVRNLGAVTSIKGYNNFTWANGFSNSSKLRYFRLPATCVSLPSESFRDCPLLTVFICDSETPASVGSALFAGSDNVVIYVPDTSVEAYKTAQNWNAYADRIRGISEL